MKKRRLSRVDLQVSLLAGCIVTISCSLIFLLNYTLSYHDMITSLQDRSNNIYTYLDQHLHEDDFLLLNTAEDMQSETYLRSKRILEDIKNAAGVRYLYTAKRTADDQYIYLVDGLPSSNTDFRDTGMPIEPEIIPDIQQAYANEIVLPQAIKSTSWGYIFISYYPIHQDDAVIGVVGIEFDAEHQFVTFRLLKLATPAVIILFCLISVIIAVQLFKRVSNPIYRDFANTDLLTGQGNRNAYDVALNNLEAKAHRQDIGFIVIDLDGLKHINDILGHAAGDDYIRTACQLIQPFVLSPNALYRIGGDEFIIIAPGTNQTQLEALVTTIIDHFAHYNQDAKPQIKASFGCAVYQPAYDMRLQDTIKRADASMYAMKKVNKQQMTDQL